MRRIDTFPYAGEGDMLELRLTEIGDAVDHVVIVEADVTHGGNRPKPYRYLEHADRFERWADKIVYVQASDLPTIEDAWSRELAQREWVWRGLESLDAAPDDIVLHGDVDEIPTALATSLVRPRGFVVFHQRFHPFALDWLHPAPWQGTVAARVSDIDTFAEMRTARLHARTVVPDAGWHLSWVSDGIEAKEAKMHSFCHPEIAPTWEGRLDVCWETGLHVDGVALTPVEIDDTWPRWVLDGNAPPTWYRPRDSNRPRPQVDVPDLIGPRLQART